MWQRAHGKVSERLTKSQVAGERDATIQGGIVRAARHREKPVALCMALVAILLAAPAGVPPRAADAPAIVTPSALRGAPAPIFPPFAHPPLDGPLVTTGSFGEYRPGRFHAGLDLSTGETVGQPVYAPLDGWIERVHASGVGYGRSIYLHAPDGRDILLGHLDAFDEPLASYVAAAQDSSGQYEQDLWPDAGRFRVRAGQRLGWSGRSGGVGQPHLHLEIRRGDMAINPLLAGASVADTTLPEITGITVEPRTADSRINGRFAPLRLALGARPETLRVSGLARVEVEARDPGLKRADMQPYEIRMRWGAHFVRCAFDSLSWASDMPEGRLIYDAGRIVEERRHAVLMWAPVGFRARAISSDASITREAGLIGLDDPSGEFPVTVTAADVRGQSRSTTFVVRLTGDDAGFRSAVLQGGAEARGQQGALPGFGWSAPAAAYFSAGASWDSIAAESLGTSVAAGELQPAGRAMRLSPGWFPLRKPILVRASVPAAHPDRQLGLYVRNGGDWELLDTEPDAATRAEVSGARAPTLARWLARSEAEWSRPSWIAHPAHLGEFAFFEDRVAPRIALIRPPHHRGDPTPYSRWALEARIAEEGSGVNARASGFIVDGKKRPTEWDAVDRKLRWKPRVAPAAGTHHYLVIAVDKAGNERRATATFVIN